MELTEFLRARLDEDEAAAYGLCGNGPLARWVIRDGDLFVGTEPLPDEPIVQTWDGRVAQHIARHDPARVLREVEAKRAIAAEHSAHYPREGSPYIDPAQLRCDIDHQEWPCKTVRALAAVWSDHADYEERA